LILRIWKFVTHDWNQVSQLTQNPKKLFDFIKQFLPQKKI
jgi:hypothetical protein